MFKNFISIIVVIILFLSIAPVSAVDNNTSADSTDGVLVATYGEGKLYQYGNLYVVELHGSYREMGRQYGALRKAALWEVYDQITAKTFWINVIGVNDLDGLINGFKSKYSAYPQYNDILLGIAETSDLGDNVYITCSIAKEFYVMGNPNQGCSFTAAWGNYTPDTRMVAGRNYDLGPSLRNYTEIVVYNPDDGSIPVAIMGYTGSVYLTSGINRDGLFMELNDGTNSAKQLNTRRMLATQGFLDYQMNSEIISSYSLQRIDTNLELFQLIQSSANVSELNNNFSNASTNVGTIINVADKNSSYSFEWMPDTYKERAPQENGLLVATNLFIDPAWNLTIPEPGSTQDHGESMLRMVNLLNLAGENKGNITPQVMMQMMSTPIEDGGPLFPNGMTSYQMVVQPSDLTVWFRVPGYYNWTAVDLKRHFR